MVITNEVNPTNDYTRIPNSVIFDNSLTAAEFRLWCQLAALPKGQKMASVNTMQDLSRECGIDKDSCRDRRRGLKDKGYINLEGKNIVVTIPPEDFQPKEVKLSKDQQLRHDLKDVWNATKPEAYAKQRNPLSEGQVTTLKLHATHNSAASLPEFLAAVLKGCKADSWWKDKSLGFSNVFGSGSPKQNKYTNVEKLFKLSSTKQATAALFDADNDQCWLDWYNSKAHKMTRVVRLEMTRGDAWRHQVDNEGDGTIYVYSDEGVVVHWTYKEGQHGVSYIPTAN